MDAEPFDWHEAGLTVGQVAARSGVAPSALRFYERQGLAWTAGGAGTGRATRTGCGAGPEEDWAGWLGGEGGFAGVGERVNRALLHDRVHVKRGGEQVQGERCRTPEVGLVVAADADSSGQAHAYQPIDIHMAAQPPASCCPRAR
jgi:hypothetical protein